MNSPVLPDEKLINGGTKWGNGRRAEISPIAEWDKMKEVLA